MQGKAKKQEEKASQKEIDYNMDIDIDLYELDVGGLENDDKDSILMTLKDVHMKEQNELVKDLKYMSEESRKIINDIVGIEDEIQNYQGQIESWIKNIGELQDFVEKVKSQKDPFKQKAQNMSKLKDCLHTEKQKRR